MAAVVEGQKENGDGEKIVRVWDFISDMMRKVILIKGIYILGNILAVIEGLSYMLMSVYIYFFQNLVL